MYSGNSDIIRCIGDKLRNKRVKAASIVAHCEELDLNRDNYIHISDLETVLIHALGRNSVSQREMHHLAKLLSTGSSSNKKGVNYMKFLDIFSDFISDYDDRTQHFDTGEDDANTNWATKRGSVGEWLQKAACPAEISNFQKFIACLEEFERNSGMKCVHTENGFVVPMGPELKASISFFMR